MAPKRKRVVNVKETRKVGRESNKARKVVSVVPITEEKSNKKVTEKNKKSNTVKKIIKKTDLDPVAKPDIPANDTEGTKQCRKSRSENVKKQMKSEGKVEDKSIRLSRKRKQLNNTRGGRTKDGGSSAGFMAADQSDQLHSTCKRSKKTLKKQHKDRNTDKRFAEETENDYSTSVPITVDITSTANIVPGQIQSDLDDVGEMSSSSDSELSVCEVKPETKKLKLSMPSVKVHSNIKGTTERIVKDEHEGKPVLNSEDSKISSTPTASCNMVTSEDEFETSQVVSSDRKSRRSQKKKPRNEQNKNKKLKVVEKKNKQKDVKIKNEFTETQTSRTENYSISAKLKKEQSSFVEDDHKKLALKNLDQSDVASVLMLMEGQSKGDNSSQGTSGLGSKLSDQESDSDVMESSEDEEEDWEDVHDHPSQCSPKKSKLPEEGVEITLDAPEIFKKRKKKAFDWKAYVQRQINRFKKGVCEDIHKVHLMCLLVRGMYLNSLCNSPDLTGQALSLIPQEFIRSSPQTCTIASITRLTQWFKSAFNVMYEETQEGEMKCLLQKRIEERKVYNMLEFVLVLVITLRSLGLKVRLIMSLQPLSFKPSKVEGSTGSKGKKNSQSSKKSTASKKTAKTENCTKSEKESVTEKIKKGTGSKSKYFKASSGKKKVKWSGKTKIEEDESSEKYQTKNSSLRSRGSKVKPKIYKQGSGSEDDDSEEDFIPVNNEDDESDSDCKNRKRKNKISVNRSKEKSSKVADISEASDNSSNDSDFEAEITNFRSPLVRKKPLKNNRKIVSSDSDESRSDSKSMEGCDQWPEVFLESEQKWICINCIKGELNKPYVIESQATQPLHYVMAFDSEGYVKDVTAKYAPNWLTETRKQRTDPDWIDETLSPYLNPDTDAGRLEDSHIKDSLIRRPMPTTVSAFKSHPLYALRRHLLKFEAIYPDSAVPLGYIRGEPVYARECVHVLHSRENWLKEGRAVRLREEAYKMVKSRPKWKRPKEDPDALDLELFGLWQTEEYIPPPAVDGKVPRNEYGNVELFKPSMLPAGTVHLKVPGLNKVAKRLGLDCVPAMMGWDTHCGFSHPVLDGFVVCEEHKDILLAAWDEDQEIQRQKEAEKREKRVVANWKLLTKGLLIKDKLKHRFDLQSKEAGDDHMEKCDDPMAEEAEDYKKSWPRNREDTKKGKKKAKYRDSEVI